MQVRGQVGGAVAALLSLALVGQAEPVADVAPAVEGQLSRLSLEDKAGQVLLTAIHGRRTPSERSRQVLASTRAGGVVLFGFNIGAPEALVELIAALQGAARRLPGGVPLVVAVDHEGGRVQRLRQGFTRLPPPRTLGRRDARAIEALGTAVGRQLRAVGINMNLAPVVEASGEDDNVVGDRAFGSSGEVATRGSMAFLRGLQAAGVAATAKHFPGNAASATDPHDQMPRLTLDAPTIRRELLPPFAAAVATNVGAVMLSHAEIPAIDAEVPVTVSHGVIAGLLRGELGYRGVVVTDDLLMRGLRARHAPREAAVRALAAGADLLMVSDASVLPAIHGGIVEAVRSGGLDAARLDAAVRRVLVLKARFRMGESPAIEGAWREALGAADRQARAILEGVGRSDGQW